MMTRAPSRSYDVQILSQSFETSLAELKTSYLDVLLLHSFNPAVGGVGESIAWMKELQRKGLIKRLGVSIGRDLFEGLAFLERENLLADCVIQAPVSTQLLSLPGKWRNLSFIAHSPFGFLDAHAMKGDGAAPPLSNLLAGVAASCRCEAVVCSMFTLAHIDQNLRAHARAGQISAFNPSALIVPAPPGPAL